MNDADKQLREQLCELFVGCSYDDLRSTDKLDADSAMQEVKAYADERVVEELKQIDQLYQWKSIETYSGYQKYKKRRIAELTKTEDKK